MIGGKLKSNLLRLWWGEVSLARAFWGYLIGGFILVIWAGILLIALIYLFAHWSGGRSAFAHNRTTIRTVGTIGARLPRVWVCRCVANL